MKRQKKLVLKVDNLHHVSDHGLSVQFSDPRLSAWVDSLKGDGEHRAEAGKSRLTVRNVGRITFTRFVSAVSGTVENVHYFSPAENLKHTVSGNSFVGLTLRWVVFGDPRPRAWDCQSGAEQDALRILLKNNAWCLLGENGLRATAMHGDVKAAQDSARVAEMQTARAKNEVERFIARDLGREVTDARERFTRLREQNRSTYARQESENADAVALVESSGDLSRVSLLSHRFGVRSDHRELVPFFPATKDTFSPEVRSPNYSAVRDGETLRVSSGIVVPFSASAVLAWLKGEAPAPRTRYGSLERVELARHYGTAWVAVKCGCHYIDGAKDLGGEFAELLKPAHTVTTVKGSPELRWSEETQAEFIARLRENSARWLASLAETQRTDELCALRVVEAAIHTHDYRETALAELRAVVAKCESEQDAAEQQAATVEARMVGADLDTLNSAVKSALSALFPLSV
jgi:hypothetical protein